MLTSSATVGVVVPVFRVEDFIAECLDSIAGQTRPADQVILVDDRGDDQSINRARQHARDIGLSIEIIAQPRNRGPAAARNVGLAGLHTDLVWFCDADDTAHPRFLETLVNALITTESDFAMCRTLRVSRDLMPIGTVEPSWQPDTQISGEQFVRGVLRTTMRAYACNRVFRRSLLGTAPFIEDIAYEDIAPAVSYGLASTSIALIDEPLYNYRDNESSISRVFAPHTTDLFIAGKDVRALIENAELSTPRAQWERDLVLFHYDGVVLPVANMALRAQSTSDVIDAAVREARRNVDWRDLPTLIGLKAFRQVIAATILALSPRLYRQILIRR